LLRLRIDRTATRSSGERFFVHLAEQQLRARRPDGALIAVSLALLLAYGGAPLESSASGRAGANAQSPGRPWVFGSRLGDRRRRADSGDAFRQLAGRPVGKIWFGTNPGLLLTGGIAALIYAYLVRFLAVALQSVSLQSGQGNAEHGRGGAQPGSESGAAFSAGCISCLCCAAACCPPGLLVFVDVMKELPATLVMRPSISIRWRRRPTRWRRTNALAEAVDRVAGHRAVGLTAVDLSCRGRFHAAIADAAAAIGASSEISNLTAIKAYQRLPVARPVEDHLRLGAIHGQRSDRQGVGLEGLPSLSSAGLAIFSPATTGHSLLPSAK
jgi:hypothetical protein